MCELNKDNTKRSKLRVGNDFWCFVEISQQETTHRTPRPVSLSSSILPPRHRSPEVAFQPEARQPSGSFRKMGISIWGLKERQNLPKVCQFHLILISCDYIVIWYILTALGERMHCCDSRVVALICLEFADRLILQHLVSLRLDGFNGNERSDWSAFQLRPQNTGYFRRVGYYLTAEKWWTMWYNVISYTYTGKNRTWFQFEHFNNQLYETCGNCQRPWTKQDLCFDCSYVAIIPSMMYSMMWFSSATAAAF